MHRQVTRSPTTLRLRGSSVPWRLLSTTATTRRCYTSPFEPLCVRVPYQQKYFSGGGPEEVLVDNPKSSVLKASYRGKSVFDERFLSLAELSYLLDKLKMEHLELQLDTVYRSLCSKLCRWRGRATISWAWAPL